MKTTNLTKYHTEYMRKWRIQNPVRAKELQQKSDKKRALKKPWLYLTSEQKEGRKIIRARYKKLHSDKIKKSEKKYKDKWMKEHPWVAAKNMANFRKLHPDRAKLIHAKYYKNHSEKVKLSSKKWRDENPDKAIELSNNWKKNNPDKVALSHRKRRNLKLNAEGSHTQGEWEHIKALYNWTCANPECRKNEPDIKLTEDHIVPLSRGGSDFIENIQPLCKSCNSRKNTKIIKFNNKII